ncbi:MAG TPA: hypothetical protein VM598_00495 [Bdellovibrionota bacterium]|nr:hypothetical protein [Bdellovibrionota bacterium]
MLALLLALLSSHAQALTPVKITVGDSHSCAVFDDGSVKCWGDNSSGQLGTGRTAGQGGAAGTMGSLLPFVNLGTGRKAIDIKANSSSTCALLDDRSLKCWGANGSGQLGYGDTQARGSTAASMGDGLKPIDLGTGRKVESFAVGYDFACAILDNSELKCWGSGSSGQVGYGDSQNRGDARNEMGDRLPSVALGIGRRAVQISAGYTHACALLDDDSVKCWGENSNGQLGQGDSVTRGDGAAEMGDLLKRIDLGTTVAPLAVHAGSTHSCVHLSDRSIRCWGDNSNGSTGAGSPGSFGDGPGEMGAALKPVDIEPGLTVDQFSCARRHCCTTFLGPGTMKCWGINDAGHLGIGDSTDRGNAESQMGQSLPFVDLGPLEAVAQIATGRYHSCAILVGGAVKCWGTNGNGQLGLGDTRNRGANLTDMGNGLPKVALY